MAPDPRGATSNCHKRGWGLTPGPMLRAPLSGSWCRTAVCSQRQTPCLMVLLSGRGGGGDSEPLHLLSHRADIAHPALPPARGGAACGAAGTQCNGPSPAPRRGSCSLGRRRSAQGTAGQGQQGALQPGSSQRQGGDQPHHTAQTRQPDRGLALPRHQTRGEGRRRGDTDAPATARGPGSPPPPSMGWCQPSADAHRCRSRGPAPHCGSCAGPGPGDTGQLAPPGCKAGPSRRQGSGREEVP